MKRFKAWLERKQACLKVRLGLQEKWVEVMVIPEGHKLAKEDMHEGRYDFEVHSRVAPCGSWKYRGYETDLDTTKEKAQKIFLQERKDLEIRQQARNSIPFLLSSRK